MRARTGSRASQEGIGIVDLQAAAAFVRRAGTDSELLRLRCLLGEDIPLDLRVREVCAGQRADGGFAPYWATDYSGVDATCFRLAHGAQADIPLELPETCAALAFLESRQRADGTWEEEAGFAPKAPSWARPGDLQATLYLTANAGSLLATARRTEPARLAAAYLLGLRGADNWLPSYLHANWLAAALFRHVGEDAAAEGILAGLAARSANLSAGALAWMVTSLAEAGVAHSHPTIAQAVQRIQKQQRADGSFPSGDGPDFDAHATLEAIRALRCRA